MKALNKTITKSLLGLFLASCAISASAQTATTASTPTKGSFTVGADLVSSYIWRGFTENKTPNIQPSATFTYGGLSIGAWGSGSFDGTYKEVDLSASYAFNDLFSLTVTDYNWAFKKSYFKYNNDSTDHIFEGTLSYAGVKEFPLSISVNTMFYGADKKLNSDSTKLKNAFSTYVELAYPIAKNAKLTIGGLYVSSKDGLNAYAVTKKGFNITNVALKVSKDLKFSESFSLPVYGIIGFNPETEDAFFVGGITF
ncbi:MAG: hypothetical protein P4L28_02615 [Paludibacteraceae bacterium]|nr:hypothetical protein [Paludibacteraceae bacterium]